MTNFICTCSEDKGASLKSQEIIEFPIVIVDVKNKCIKSTFKTLVKPTIDTKLTGYCTELTGITQEQVDGAVDLQTAVTQAHEFLEKEGVFGTEFVFLQYGEFFGKQLMVETKTKNINVPSYMRRWINIRKIFPADYEN